MGENEVLDAEGVGILAGMARRLFDHVYVDDGKSDANTACPNCQLELIKRVGTRIEPRKTWKTGERGECSRCGHDCNIKLG